VSAARRIAERFGLERNLIAVSAAMFIVALGENLWKKFLPRYLQVLGAPVSAVGLYGSAEDFLDGVYQYPGGWLGDHLGRRNALLAFTAAAAVGYAIYACAPSWPWALVALLFVMAWSSMASPTLFAVVGDALPKERRAIGFTVQSILKRVPIVVAPVIGGLAIVRLGFARGMHVSFLLSILLGIAAVFVVARVRIERLACAPTNIRGVWRSFPPPLRSLLVSDVFIRTCEGLVDEFGVIYLMTIVRVTPVQFGVLVAVQTATAIAVYLPAAAIADRIGRKPFVIATFTAFALFPLAVALAHDFRTAIVAYVIGGLREIGEPSRKALIVDLARPELRARTVGLYYLIRSVAIAPAAVTGGLLYGVRPELPFLAAMIVGLAGTVVFAVTVKT
jgi:MFS family permease